jgi:hypothetical protein
MFDDSTAPPGTDRPGPTPVRIATYGSYAEAQAAVDTLSDDGFPVASVTIVWRNLRRVEHVVGRRTVLTAAVEGLLAGAWFGSLIGLLFAVLADTEVSSVGFVLTYLVIGALAGAAWQAVGHALRRGQRDFATLPQIDAETYELWVAPDLAGQASSVLGLSSTRVIDPA